jgi:hypothetical protein
MRATTGLLACTSDNNPTESEGERNHGAGRPNVDRRREHLPRTGPHPFGTVMGPSVGVLTNSAGESVVHVFGGCDWGEGSLGHCTVSGIRSYNVATDTWSGDYGAPPVWRSNGVGAMGASCTPRAVIPFYRHLTG